MFYKHIFSTEKRFPKCGQFAHPLFISGDYPPLMREVIDRRSKNEGRAWSRLPVMTAAEKVLIKGYYFTYK